MIIVLKRLHFAHLRCLKNPGKSHIIFALPISLPTAVANTHGINALWFAADRARENKAGEDLVRAQLSLAQHEQLYEAAHRGWAHNGHDAPAAPPPGAGGANPADLAAARAGGPRWFEERHEALSLRLAAACEQVGCARKPFACTRARVCVRA